MGVYPTAAGIRDIGSSTMKYTPVIYSGKLLKKLYTRTVFGEIANTDYEGDIKAQGDTVEIRRDPDITIREHSKGQTLKSEQPVAEAVTLLIDKGFYWDFSTNTVDDAQTDIKNYTERWTTVASKQLKIRMDSTVLGDVYADVSAYNCGATAGKISGDIDLGVNGGASVALSKANVLDKIVECGQVLDEQDVPEDDRWIIIPSWMASLLKTSDLKNVSITGDETSPIRNGRIGMIDTFTVYKSNQLARTADGNGVTCTNILFGSKLALTFATQLTENQVIDNPFAFGRLFRGLVVFGYKVVMPEAMGCLFARKDAA